jgi:hypothetical protein
MHFTIYLSALIAPLATIAAPVDAESGLKAISARQASLVKPAPCVRDASTTKTQTKLRSEAFARAFIYEKDITEAFKYIVLDYIVRSFLSSFPYILTTPLTRHVNRITTLWLKTARTQHGAFFHRSGQPKTLPRYARPSRASRVG